jgi:hypothetical protein
MDARVTLDAYVLDTLMADLVGHDRSPAAFIVYLLLWRQTHAVGAGSVELSLRALAESTGLSKRGIQDALTVLSRRRLVSIAREGITDVPCYTVLTPWRR